MFQWALVTSYADSMICYHEYRPCDTDFSGTQNFKKYTHRAFCIKVPVKSLCIQADNRRQGDIYVIGITPQWAL